MNIWVKLILKKKNSKFKFLFQCLALPKDPQSFGSQNLRCPFLVSQYYRCRRLCRELCLENKTEQSMNFKNHTVFLLKLFYLVSKVRPIFTEVVSFVKNYHLIEKNYHLIESWKLFSYLIKLYSQNKTNFHKESLLLTFRHLIIKTQLYG